MATTTSDLKVLNDNDLLEKTQLLVTQERVLTAEILQYLAEIESRRLYAKRGFSSLWEFATVELKYSSSAAYRRIDAMRLLKTLTPVAREETKVALNEGRLNLSAVNAMTQFLKDEKKENHKTYSAAEKQTILKQLEGQSKPQCEKILAAINPTNHDKAQKHVDQTRAISGTRVEVCFAMGEELGSKLEQIKNLLAHQFNGTPTYEELLLKMSQIVLERIDPMTKAMRKEKGYKTVGSKSQCKTRAKASGNATVIRSASESKTDGSNRANYSSAAEVKNAKSYQGNMQKAPRVSGYKILRRYIAKHVIRVVWRRDKGQCTYVDKTTGRRCVSKHRLQLDHDIPFSFGGNDTVENLSLKCRAHNSWLAIEKLGRPLMAHFIPGLDSTQPLKQATG